ncbi:hypothetical protein PF005_g16330 [Phytophthora fragariae]|uniref:TIL domain-containing protein n=1 Tax=Phytophthora fragariae TaxID=53985 RepID=A0A6A3XF11_9STRA|nr:hypothetical protein PF007_g10528 [Phytophthora fragariae]KAE9142345.1 hypothetical protein PF006_g12535 [Phytophthora fragariae]KAE9197925.1 hypothetical protein PF005_g16330 [Phytophthora fragariae]KAE9304900.1 hypothetical protein PF001_g12849 [Phytophthora fragariae]KAE9330216.1 hypothetical protein PF008_g15766 [Phytophthora fragariae]
MQMCVAGPSGSESSPQCTLECSGFQECRVYEPDKSEYCADRCSKGRCPEGSSCELQEVKCIKAPCPPVASCNSASAT